MLVGVMADSHDNLPNVEKALRIFKEAGVEAVFHLGDFVAPFTLKKVAEAEVPVYAVFGNNDGEREVLRRVATREGINLSSQPAFVEVNECTIALLHGTGTPDDTLAVVERMARSADVVLYGHTHRREAREVEGALILNPGETLGYLTGEASVALLDLETLEVEFRVL